MGGFRYRKWLQRAAFGLIPILSLAFLYNVQSVLNPPTTIRAMERTTAPAEKADSPIFLNGSGHWGRVSLLLTQWTKKITVWNHETKGGNKNQTFDGLQLGGHRSSVSLAWTNINSLSDEKDDPNENLILNVSSQHRKRESWMVGPSTKNITITNDGPNDPRNSITESSISSTSSQTSHVVNGRRDDITVPDYSQKDILRFLFNEMEWYAKYHLLIFENGQFHVYILFQHQAQMGSCKCTMHLMEVIVDGLVKARPQRFTSTSPPWQGLLDITRDNVYYPCMENETFVTGCSKAHPYPPIITIASVPKETLLPFLFQLPTIYHNDCIYYMRRQQLKKRAVRMCPLRVKVHQFATFTDQIWESLTPQVFWRGSDLSSVPEKGGFYRQCLHALPQPRRSKMPWSQVAELMFLEEKTLTPRCRAAILSAKVEEEWMLTSQNSTLDISASHVGNNRSQPWLNVKFGGYSKHHLRYVSRGYGALVDDYTHASNMSKFKYQIDFGGVGGTTWLGTITKLAMPGLLFHHETPSKDFFHDELQPWVHYVPVHNNLSNLYDMFVWAETHPEEAKQIAQQGQQYAHEHVSTRHLEITYENAYVNRFRPIVDAYEPAPQSEGHGETLTSILQEYESRGFNISLVATCKPSSDCQFVMRPVN